MKKYILNPISMFLLGLILGIILVSILSTIILFDRLRVYDFVINGILIYYLFFKKIKRNKNA